MMLNHIRYIVGYGNRLKQLTLMLVLFPCVLLGCFDSGEDSQGSDPLTAITPGCGGSDSDSNSSSTGSEDQAVPAPTDDEAVLPPDDGHSADRDDGTTPNGDEDQKPPGKDDDPAPVAVACAPSAAGQVQPVSVPQFRMSLPGSWDENWFASPAVADIDGDGSKEIIAARHSVLYVWSADGTLLWKTAFGHSASSSPEHGACRMWAPPVVEDFDGDQELEIAVGGDADSSIQANISLYDHQGELLPGWPQRFGDTEVRSIAAADVDGDGVLEVLVNKTNTGPATAVYELDGRMHANWPQVSDSCHPSGSAEPCWDFGGYNQNIGAADMDGDGIKDVVSSYDALGFGIFDGDGNPFPTASGFSDAVVTAVEAYHDLALSKQGWGMGDRSEFTCSPPVMADIDSDGQMEIVLAGDHEHTQSSANQGVTLWVFKADMTRPTGWEWPMDLGPPLESHRELGHNIVHTMPNPSVAHLYGDGGPQIIVPGYDGVMYAFHPNGDPYWYYQFTKAATPYVGASEAVVADLNQDGVPEVVFTTYCSGQSGSPDATAHLIILSADGTLLHQVVLDGRGSMAAPTIADSDDDGMLEIIISLKDGAGEGRGGVQIWDLPGSATNCVLWETGRGGFHRQGQYLAPE